MKFASAYVELYAKDSKFKAAMMGSHSSLKRFTSVAPTMIKGVTKALGVLTVAAAATAAAFSALVVQTTRSFARLQNNMARVSTMIQGSWQKTTAVLTKGVRQLSLEIPQTTKELTAALYDILSAGAPVARSIEALGIAGKAAVAGVSDVTTASNLLMGTINGMGLAFDSMQDVSDLAFSTVEQGVITFGELSSSIGRAMSGANKLGASVQELYGSMAFLTKQNLSAEMSATALGAMFDELASKSKELAVLGVKVFGEEGEYRGILAVIEDISTELSGLTQQAKTNVLEEMGFERQAARAIIAMTTNLEDFRITMADVADSAGATEAAYAKMKDTLINQWAILKNSLSNLATVIGKSFAGTAANVIKTVKEIVDTLSNAIDGAGGLGELWKLHKNIAIGAFKDIVAAGVILTGSLLAEMGKLIKLTGKFIWIPLKLGFMITIKEIGQIWKENLSWLFPFNRQIRKEIKESSETLTREVAQMQRNAQLSTSALVATTGDEVIASLGRMKGAFSGFTDAAIKALAPFKALRKEAAGIITPAPAAAVAAGPGPTVTPSVVRPLFPEMSEAAAKKRMEIAQKRAADLLDLTVRLNAKVKAVKDLRMKYAKERAALMIEIMNRLNAELVDKTKKTADKRMAIAKKRAADLLDLMKRLNIKLVFVEDLRMEKAKERAAYLLGLMKRLNDKADAAAEKIKERWDNVTRQISDAFESVFSDMLQGQIKSWGDFFDRIVDIGIQKLTTFAGNKVFDLIRGLFSNGDTKIEGVTKLASASVALQASSTNIAAAAAHLNAAAARITAGDVAGPSLVDSEVEPAAVAGSGGDMGGIAAIVTLAELSRQIGNLIASISGTETTGQRVRTGLLAAPFGLPAFIASQVGGFAAGGIITRPTLAMVGEKGPEKIIPLTGPNANKGVGMTTNHFHTTIQVTEFDLDTMSQAKVNAWMNSKGYNALKDMASKGKINPSMV